MAWARRLTFLVCLTTAAFLGGACGGEASVDAPDNSRSADASMPDLGSDPVDQGGEADAVLNVYILEDDANVRRGEFRELTGWVEVRGNPDQTLTWTSSDEETATVDAEGVVRGVANGPFTIRATSVANPDKFDEVRGVVSGSIFKGPDNREGDEQALVDLFNSTNGENWVNTTGWDATSMSLDDEIFGVQTEEIAGELRVTEVHLNHDGSHDIVHDGEDDQSETFVGNGLTGTLPESLQNLKSCRYFNVRSNAIGGHLPVGIKDMKSLEYLFLSGTRVTVASDPTDGLPYGDPRTEEGFGTVTAESDQSFKGRFEGGLPPEWGQLPAIKIIQVGRTAEFDEMPTNHPNLDPDKPGIGGPLPADWGQMETLEMLDVSGNRHTSELPPEWGALRNLQHLEIGTNPDITGELPQEWGGANGFPGMRRLREIDLPGVDPIVEQTDGQLEGGFPDSWKNMKMIRGLSAAQTFKPGAEFPDFFFDGSFRDRVTTDDPDPEANPVEAFDRDVATFTLIGNGFVGNQFPELSAMKPVRLKISRESGLSGDVSGMELSSFGERIVEFWLDSTDFTGQWPALTSWSECESIRLQDNQFSGPLPLMGPNNERFRDGMFQNNAFTEIPQQWGDLPWSDPFERLWLHDNELSGTIPAGLASKSYDDRLRLENNRFVFRDLVPFLGAKADLSDVTYAPQKPFGNGESIAVDAGDAMTIDTFELAVTHADNQYQWFKDGSEVSGATTRTFSQNEVTASDAGDYVLQVTNASAPELTLESDVVRVTVN